MMMVRYIYDRVTDDNVCIYVVKNDSNSRVCEGTGGDKETFEQYLRRNKVGRCLGTII